MNDVREVTRDFEQWLATVIDVVPDGLDAKHAAIGQSDLAFLRGTYYLWLVRVHALLPDVLIRAAVPTVGDLHVENFGTWRDTEQVRRWGVNDLDELARGSWLLDVLRLATSAAVSPHVHLDDADACAELLSAYAAAEPRPATSLAQKGAGHLAGLVPEFHDTARYYAHLAEGAAATVPPDVARAAAGVAESGWTPSWHAHDAGTGSLGHVRAVGVGPAADGTMHAREAKQLGPGTTVWAARHMPDAPVVADLYPAVTRVVRGPAGATRVRDWQVRDLAPDVVRIELSGLHHKDARHLMHSMAYAVADVHGADPDAAATARAEAAAYDVRQLASMVATMTAAVRADRATWLAH